MWFGKEFLCKIMLYMVCKKIMVMREGLSSRLKVLALA